MSYQIAIIGPEEAIEGFSLLGVTTVPASDPEAAIATLKEMKKATLNPEEKEKNFAIIFVTEDIARHFSPEEEKYFARDALPSIIPLPSHLGPSDYSRQRLSHIVERAVGSDILK